MTDVDRTQLRQMADDIVQMIWSRLSSHLVEAFAERIALVAAEQWRWAWTNSDVISKEIDDAIERHLRETYRPALEEIGRQKARRKVLHRAKQAGVSLELPGMDEEGGKP